MKNEKMTQKECFAKLDEIKSRYRAIAMENKLNKEKEIATVLSVYAKTAAKFSVGDFLEKDGVVILVKKIIGYENNYIRRSVKIMYRGERVTEKLKQAKQKITYDFTEDDTIRKIEPIKTL